MAMVVILNPPNAVDGGPASLVEMPIEFVKDGKTHRSHVVCPGITIWDHFFAQALHGGSNLGYAEWLQHRIEVSLAKEDVEAAMKAQGAAGADIVMLAAFAEQVANRAMEVRFSHIQGQLPQQTPRPEDDNGEPRIIRPDFTGDK